MSCPFLKVEEHEDTPDVDDRIDFTSTPPIRVPAKIPVSNAPRPLAAARVRRRPVRTGLLAGAADVPKPLIPALATLESTQTPPPGAEPVPGRVEIEGKPGGADITVRSIMRAAEEAVGRVPQKASFSAKDFKFFRETGIANGSVQEQGRLAGQARVDAIQTQMAEEATAEAVSPVATTQIDVLRQIVQRPPAALVAIPLLAEAFRLLRRSSLFRSAVPIRPGLIGTAGPADPAAAKSQFVTDDKPRIQSAQGRFKGRDAPAPRRGLPGGMMFNAAERMRQMVGVSRRKVGGFGPDPGLN